MFDPQYAVRTMEEASLKIDTLESLVKKQDEYIKFLAKAESDLFSIAHVHGFRYPESVIEEGAVIRQDIKNLKELIK